MNGLEVLADVLVVLGLIVMTVGVLGVFRMPDAYTQLHASSKAVVFGLIAILVAASTAWSADIVMRAILIGAFLILTTPVAAHAIARAAYRTGEPFSTPGAIDESGVLKQPPEPPAGEPPS